MSPRQIVDVLVAIEHASHVGLQPTHMITINWQQLGVIDSVKATGRFLKYLKDAAARRGWPTSHIWIREVGTVVGDHVHTHDKMAALACIENPLKRHGQVEMSPPTACAPMAQQWTNSAITISRNLAACKHRDMLVPYPTAA